MVRTRTRALALATALALPVGACSFGGGGGDETPPPTSAEGAQGGAADDDETSTGTDDSEQSSEVAAPPSDPGRVVLVTHDSFNVPEELVAQFETQTGYDLEIQLSGDAGELTNQLVLTAGRPVADAVFGIDTTFASRAVGEEVLAAYTPAGLPESAEEHALAEGEAAYLTPVDYGDVCVNIDNVWFANNGVEPPQTLLDLTKPEYEDLFVTPGATTSSPGMSFLLATIGAFGPGEWQPYWEDLMANGAKVTSGWTDAYSVDFTAGGGDGDRPIVLSYASSPPFTIPEGGWQPTTSALLDTCFRQVEYAGVLEGAANPEGAQAVVDWLVSPEVQASIPDNMYMYPVSDEVALPELWAQFAPLAEDPIVVPPRQIEEERETWLREWADIATGGTGAGA
ncbi:thiamine ABC transporter substrate-binding protein [Ornithinimicrobium pekingense]|uniref:Thiamine ABC transporter substrate-binding protein n=1 Tax=Ornithinimicrobium pekingense TaxID=384677 RepID=A0ABQ2FBX1_9MICO|nr:thiamine ABC transporter substrate-binding protein [Ornithinimicrobium pekingense]GGK79279.1 thiamine ABC transporter substrate-binding protein [Ornithinimicrobium pekingense]